MSDGLRERLNRILPRLMSEGFLHNKGLGNEIGFWIFDYLPEHEMQVRAFVEQTVLPALGKCQPPLRYAIVNLFELVIGLLEDRNLYERTLEKQAKQGNDAVLKSLRPVLKEDKLAERIASQVNFAEIDMLLLTGVGAAFPMVRSHTLLAALQPVMKATPLVMFYPGRYDGHTLRLFNQLTDDNYYRAFELVD